MAQQMLKHVIELVKAPKFEKAASDCYLIEWIWKLLSETKFLLEFGFVFIFMCWVDKKDQWLGLCFCVWLTRKSKKILKNLVCDSYI